MDVPLSSEDRLSELEHEVVLIIANLAAYSQGVTSGHGRSSFERIPLTNGLTSRAYQELRDRKLQGRTASHNPVKNPKVRFNLSNWKPKNSPLKSRNLEESKVWTRHSGIPESAQPSIPDEAREAISLESNISWSSISDEDDTNDNNQKH